jgi:hypothetical protein
MNTRRRWLWRLGAVLLLALPAAAGTYLLFSGRGTQPREGTTRDPAEEELRLALEEADRLDPGWRLADLEAKRRDYADAENSAVCIRAVDKLLPADWTAAELPEPKPVYLCYSDEQADLVRQQLEKCVPALSEARRLRSLPGGRHPIVWAPDFVSTKVDYLGPVSRCAYLLEWEVAWQLLDGNVDEALAACRNEIHVGRSNGDAPLPMCHISRLACEMGAARNVERILAHGAPSSDSLRVVQQMFEEQAAQPSFLSMLRGERIWVETLLTGLAYGKLKWSTYNTEFVNKNRPKSGSREEAELDARMATLAREGHGRVLHHANLVVEIGRLPPHEWRARLEALNPSSDDPLGPLYLEWQNYVTICRRSQALIRCAAVLLAAERFRQALGAWPKQVSDLTPDYLSQTQLDAFDGAPLRLRRLTDGIVVYSVGFDGKDDGGALKNDGFPPEPGSDLGYRLWDVNRRRQVAVENGGR